MKALQLIATAALACLVLQGCGGSQSGQPLQPAETAPETEDIDSSPHESNNSRSPGETTYGTFVGVPAILKGPENIKIAGLYDSVQQKFCDCLQKKLSTVAKEDIIIPADQCSLPPGRIFLMKKETKPAGVSLTLMPEKSIVLTGNQAIVKDSAGRVTHVINIAPQHLAHINKVMQQYR